MLSEEGLADSVDWRTKGAVNPVKYQGHCGSCWAFSATAAIESHHFIATGHLLNLSEQELVDCVTVDSHGCSGGSKNAAMEYVKTHGHELWDTYPYNGKDGTCKYAAASGKVNVKTVASVTPNSVPQLKAAIAKGPTSVGVEADKSVFVNYKSGIINSADCGTNTNHAVVAVGYGTSGSTEYYIVRNSYSSAWGMNGYVNIAAVAGAGICGIQTSPVYPTTS